MRNLRICLLLIGGLWIGTYALAQSIEVELLTDDQVRQFWERLQEEGYSFSQVRNVMISRGMTEENADLFISRAQGLNLVEVDAQDVSSEGDIRELESQLRLQQSAAELEQAKVYGYSIFNNEAINFISENNLPTPPDYVLGAGDELLIEIYGTSQSNYKVKVNREGKISIPLVGPLQLSGLTVLAAKAKLKRELSQIYVGLSGANPTVFLEVTLNTLKSISVNVIGEVVAPGVYQISSFSSIFNALYVAGGPSLVGSLRQVDLYRGGQKVETMDLYQYLFEGIIPNTTSLQNNDIILVRAFDIRVEVKGEVKSPGIYELTEDDEMADIIKYAGGFSARAFESSVTVERLVGEDQKILDVTFEDDFSLQNGDAILVKEAQDFLVEKVQIEGAVARPGRYSWREGMTLKDLLARAGGLKPEAITDNTTIFKKKDDLTTSVRNVNLADSSAVLQVLNRGDLVLVSSKLFVEEKEFVQIDGEVRRPAVIPYYEGMTIKDVVLLASGITPAGVGGFIEVVRKEPGKSLGSAGYDVNRIEIQYDEELLSVVNDDAIEPYDYVYVRRSPNYREVRSVRVSGQVLAPGEYLLLSDKEKISSILERTGGFTEAANPAGAYVLRSPVIQTPDEIYLNRMMRLSAYVNTQLAGGTLSTSEKEALEERINDFRQIPSSQPTEDDEVLESERIAIDLSNYGTKDFTSNVQLEDGDRLVVPRLQETVAISGQVEFPTITQFQPSKKMKDYIDDAGGAMADTKRSRAYIVYANGRAARIKSFLMFRNYPKVEPGSEIIIPAPVENPSRFRLDLNQALQAVTTLTSLIIAVRVLQDTTL